MKLPSRRLTSPDTLRRHFNMVNQSKGTVGCSFVQCWLTSCWVNIQLELATGGTDMFFGPAWAKRVCPSLSSIKCGQPIWLWEAPISPSPFGALILYEADIKPAFEKKNHTICQTVWYWQLLLGEDGENVFRLVYVYYRCICRLDKPKPSLFLKWEGAGLAQNDMSTEQVLRMSVLLWIRELKQNRIPSWSGETQTGKVSSHSRIKTHFCTGSPGTSMNKLPISSLAISHILGKTQVPSRSPPRGGLWMPQARLVQGGQSFWNPLKSPIVIVNHNDRKI